MKNLVLKKHRNKQKHLGKNNQEGMRACTQFAKILLDEAKRVYGEKFEYDDCTIIRYDDGTYSVEFSVRSSVRSSEGYKKEVSNEQSNAGG